jgi:hypothetical protein
MGEYAYDTCAAADCVLGFLACVKLEPNKVSAPSTTAVGAVVEDTVRAWSTSWIFEIPRIAVAATGVRCS